MKLRLKKIGLVLLSALLSFNLFSQAEGSLSFNLEEAQNYAVQNSYMSINAKKDIEISERKVKETISTGLPQVNGGVSYQNYLQTPKQLIPAEAFGGPEGTFEEVFFGTEQQVVANITANQLIFDGSYFVGLQASKVYLELSKNDLKKSDIEVKNMVTESYGNVLVAKRNIEILKGNLENLKQISFETEELYKNGFVEEQDKDQINLDLANVRNSYEQAVRQIDILKNQLKFIMGVDVNSTIILTDDLESITSGSLSDSYLNKEFDVTSHIDYKILNTQEQATNLLLKQQKSTYLPSLSAFYTYQQSSFSNEFDFHDDAKWFPAQLIGLNLNVPIFSGFGRSNRVQQAKLNLEKVKVSKKQVEQQLTIRAQNARSQYTFALSQYNTTKDNLELAQRIYDRTKIKYDEGIVKSLDLTQANNQLLTTQGNFISAALQLINAKTELDKALNQ